MNILLIAVQETQAHLYHQAIVEWLMIQMPGLDIIVKQIVDEETDVLAAIQEKKADYHLAIIGGIPSGKSEKVIVAIKKLRPTAKIVYFTENVSMVEAKKVPADLILSSKVSDWQSVRLKIEELVQAILVEEEAAK